MDEETTRDASAKLPPPIHVPSAPVASEEDMQAHMQAHMQAETQRELHRISRLFQTQTPGHQHNPDDSSENEIDLPDAVPEVVPENDDNPAGWSWKGVVTVVLLVVGAAGAIAAGVVFLLRDESSSYSFDQSDAFFTIWEVLAPTLQEEPTFVDTTILASPTSTAHRTLNWMANSNHPDLTPMIAEDAQANAMRLLEYYAVVSIYFSLDGANWNDKMGFLSDDADLCDWYSSSGGVTCDNGHVVEVALGDRYMRGTLDPALYHLSHLEKWSMDMKYNYFRWFRGSIFSHIGMLSMLSELTLVHMELRGAFPSELYQLTQLTHLDLNHNDFTGRLPSEIGQLTALTYLDLGWTDFAGRLPSEIGQLTALVYLSLASFDFTRQLPSEIGQLTALTFLDMGGNNFTGQLPSEIGQLTALTFLDMGGNNFTGQLPSEIGQLTALISLDLRWTDFTGQLPSQIGQLTALTYLDLRGTKFTRPLPTQLGLLTSLK